MDEETLGRIDFQNQVQTLMEELEVKIFKIVFQNFFQFLLTQTFDSATWQTKVPVRKFKNSQTSQSFSSMVTAIR